METLGNSKNLLYNSGPSVDRKNISWNFAHRLTKRRGKKEIEKEYNQYLSRINTILTYGGVNSYLIPC